MWVDPLDGTSEFIRGNLEAVTVLIGLAVDGRSKLGVIHSPFERSPHKQPYTLFGSEEHGAFRVDSENNE